MRDTSMILHQASHCAAPTRVPQFWHHYFRRAATMASLHKCNTQRKPESSVMNGAFRLFLYYTLKYSFLNYRSKNWGTLSAPLWCEPRTRPRLRRHSVIHCVLKVLIQHDSGDEFCVNFCNSGKFKFVSKYWFSYFRASDKPSGELVWTDLQPCIHILSLKHIYLQLFQHCHLGINKNQLGIVLKVFHQEMQFKKFIIDRWVGRWQFI